MTPSLAFEEGEYIIETTMATLGSDQLDEI